MSITSTLWSSSYCPQQLHLQVCLCHYLGETQKTISSCCFNIMSQTISQLKKSEIKIVVPDVDSNPLLQPPNFLRPSCQTPNSVHMHLRLKLSYPLQASICHRIVIKIWTNFTLCQPSSRTVIVFKSCHLFINLKKKFELSRDCHQDVMLRKNSGLSSSSSTSSECHLSINLSDCCRVSSVYFTRAQSIILKFRTVQTSWNSECHPQEFGCLLPSLDCHKNSGLII